VTHDGRLVVPELLSIRAAEEPERPALIVDGAGTITFGAWEDRSNAGAHALAGRGIRRGDRVGLVFGERDWIEFAVATCAVLKAGGVIVPVSDRLAPGTVRHILLDCSVSGILHGGSSSWQDGTLGEAWQATVPELAGDTTKQPRIAVSPDDLAQILYTSGTTGKHKGVATTHVSLTVGGHTINGRRRLAHSEHFLHAFPIGTAAGQSMLLNALEARPAMLTLPRFTPERFARLISSYRPGTVYVVPAMAAALLEAAVKERHDLSSVQLLGSGAAVLPPRVAADLAVAFPNATIVNYYMSTESMPTQTTMVVDSARPGSVGRPAVGSAIKITGSDGRPTAPGEPGDVWMRTSEGSRAYYQDQAETKRVFQDDWVRMGDIGYLDDQGYLYLLDRESDIIKSAAFKVSTIQVETALYDHPAVAEAAVFGVPDQMLGTAVGAAIVARSPVTASELRQFLSTRLARHEIPVRLLFLETLPRNHIGKVLKQDLRALLTQEPTDGQEPDGGDASPLSAIAQYWWHWIHEVPDTRPLPTIHTAIRIRETVDYEALDDALTDLAGRHEALRSIVAVREGEPVLVRQPIPHHCLSRKSAQGEDRATRLADAKAIAAHEAKRPFDVATGPLLRALLIRVDEDDYVLVIVVHHLVFDRWSVGVMLRDLALYYSARRMGTAPSQALAGAPRASFTGFIAAERARWPAAATYWERELDGAPVQLASLPRRRSDARAVATDERPVPLDAAIPDLFRAAAQRHRMSVSMVVIAAWAAVLGLWSGSTDLVLAQPVSGRIRPEYEDVIGCLFRWIFIRVRPEPARSLDDLLRTTRAALLAGIEHQHFDYGRFHRQVRFPAYFRFESWGREPHLPGLACEPFAVPAGTTMEWPLAPGDRDLYPPELLVSEAEDGALTVTLIYNRLAYDAADIDTLAIRTTRAWLAMASRPEEKLARAWQATP
jgi:acyl-CoA synthetase (AMP-forming)/AMP-acid ligase II